LQFWRFFVLDDRAAGNRRMLNPYQEGQLTFSSGSATVA
jgi:hypothetical protein